MTIIATDPTRQRATPSSYFRNLGAPARALLAALFGHTAAQAAADAVSPRVRAATVATLRRMADRHDAISPNFATELRYLAARV